LPVQAGLDDLGRVPGNNAVFWHGMNHHASRGDYAAFAHISHDYGCIADPAVPPNGYLLSAAALQVYGSFQVRVSVLPSSAYNTGIGTDESVIANMRPSDVATDARGKMFAQFCFGMRKSG
jgi:hypothetical protein